MKKMILASLSVMALMSCGSGAGGANIYVSGYNGNDTTAVYLQNGTQVNLNNDSRPAKAAGIFVDSGNIYVVGQCDTSTTAYACYWTNGTKTFLKSTSTTDYQTIGNGIYVANGKVYVAGQIVKTGTGINSAAAYWVDNTASCKELSGPELKGDASSVFVTSAGDIYIGGMENATPDAGLEDATYWNNNSYVHVADHTYIKSIYVSGGKVYSAGYETNSYGSPKAVYYIGGEKQTMDIPSEATISQATGIYVVGTDVYVSGYYTIQQLSGTQAAYWKNGVKVDLEPIYPLGSDYYASAIFVKGSDIYVAGYFHYAGQHIACYWMNGVKTNLTFGEAGDAQATGIFVE